MKSIIEKSMMAAMVIMLVTIVALMLALRQAWRNEKSLDANLNHYTQDKN